MADPSRKESSGFLGDAADALRHYLFPNDPTKMEPKDANGKTPQEEADEDQPSNAGKQAQSTDHQNSY